MTPTCEQPEARILWDALRTTSATGRVQARASDIDWARFILLLKHNQVFSRVYSSLDSKAKSGIPTEVGLALRNGFLELTQHSMRMHKQLVTILSILSEAGLPCIPYKGLRLAERLYPNVAHRQCWDIDLLFRSSEDAVRATEALGQLGYAWEGESVGASMAGYLKYDCELTLHDANGGPTVEVHWRLLPPFLGSIGDADFMWRDAAEARFESIPVMQESERAMLRMLCLHGGMKHAWSELRLVDDVARWIEVNGPTLIRDVIGEIPEQYREGASVGVFLAQRLLNSEAAAETSETSRYSPGVVSRAAMALSLMFRHPSGLPKLAQWTSDVAWLAPDSPEPTPGRLRYLLDMMKPQFPDKRALPPAVAHWVWLQYVSRGIRLLRRNRAGALRRV